IAVVVEQPRRLPGLLPAGHDLGRLGQHLLVHVAQRHDLDRCNLDQPQQVDLPIPPGPDQPHPQWLRCVRGMGDVRAERRGGEGGPDGVTVNARRGGLRDLSNRSADPPYAVPALGTFKLTTRYCPSGHRAVTTDRITREPGVRVQAWPSAIRPAAWQNRETVPG